MDTSTKPTAVAVSRIALTVNGQPRQLELDTRTSLLDALREHPYLTGTKKGCSMTFGVGMALLEEAVVDLRSGAFVSCDLAGYLVPVHADIPMIDAVILDGFDGKANVLGVKGLGELGICGAPAAVGNAVFNATAVRVRDFPITLDKLLPPCHSKSD